WHSKHTLITMTPKDLPQQSKEESLEDKEEHPHQVPHKAQAIKRHQEEGEGTIARATVDPGVQKENPRTQHQRHSKAKEGKKPNTLFKDVTTQCYDVIVIA